MKPFFTQTSQNTTFYSSLNHIISNHIIIILSKYHKGPCQILILLSHTTLCDFNTKSISVSFNPCQTSSHNAEPSHVSRTLSLNDSDAGQRQEEQRSLHTRRT